MQEALSTLGLIADFFFQQVDHIWILYTGGSILGLALVLWILDRLFHIFDILKR